MGETGVQIVSQIINSFGWIFRRNHQETDFGIDGHVEVVSDDGFLTGQIFAVQIKYGKSFFKSKNRWGYIYRGEEKHFNYIFNYPCPVFIIICNPDSQKSFWSVFEPNKTQKAGLSWTLTIDFENNFGHAKETIKTILPPISNGLNLLDEYWNENHLIINSDYIYLIIDRSDIENLNIDQIPEFFKRLKATKELAYHCLGRIEIGFHGYDEDSRELYEIEQFRKYISAVVPLLPEFFFFVRTNEPNFTLKVFFASLCNLERVIHDRSTGLKNIIIEAKFPEIENFMVEKFQGLNNISEWLGLSEDENYKISRSVAKCILPESPGQVQTE